MLEEKTREFQVDACVCERVSARRGRDICIKVTVTVTVTVTVATFIMWIRRVWYGMAGKDTYLTRHL